MKFRRVDKFLLLCLVVSWFTAIAFSYSGSWVLTIFFLLVACLNTWTMMEHIKQLKRDETK